MIDPYWVWSSPKLLHGGLYSLSRRSRPLDVAIGGPFLLDPQAWSSEKESDGSWWSARVVIYQRAHIISIPKKSFSLYHSSAGPPGTTTRAGVVTCPNWKISYFFLDDKKKHGSVSAGCLYNLFYMFFTMVLSSFCWVVWVLREFFLEKHNGVQKCQMKAEIESVRCLL